MAYEVTIGIPVYNVEKYIRLAMDSALSQTFESIEFLILDDCGTDGSIDIVREYQQTHLRGKDIRIVRQPQNGGIGLARNRIIDEAQGRYLYFLDADDSIETNTIEKLYNSAIKYEADMVYGSYQRIEVYGGEIKKINYCYPAQNFLIENEFAERVYRDYGFLQATTWNVLINTNVILTNHLRFKAINFWEDFILTMDLPTYVTRVVLLPDITYYYYCRNGSLSNFQKRKSISKQELLATIRAMDDVKASSGRLRGKSFFPLRMQKVMMTDLYIVCSIFRNEEIIAPPFTKREIRDVMCSPLSVKEIFGFSQAKWINLILYSFGKLPPTLSVMLMKLFARTRKLV